MSQRVYETLEEEEKNGMHHHYVQCTSLVLSLPTGHGHCQYNSGGLPKVKERILCEFVTSVEQFNNIQVLCLAYIYTLPVSNHQEEVGLETDEEYGVSLPPS